MRGEKMWSFCHWINLEFFFSISSFQNLALYSFPTYNQFFPNLFTSFLWPMRILLTFSYPLPLSTRQSPLCQPPFFSANQKTGKHFLLWVGPISLRRIKLTNHKPFSRCRRFFGREQLHSFLGGQRRSIEADSVDFSHKNFFPRLSPSSPQNLKKFLFLNSQHGKVLPKTSDLCYT